MDNLHLTPLQQERFDLVKPGEKEDYTRCCWMFMLMFGGVANGEIKRVVPHPATG